MAEEFWRPVSEWEGAYEVSNIGNVRRCLASAGAVAGRVLKAWPRRDYLCVHLSAGGRTSFQSVHTLVAAAFVGPRPLGFTVNHRDGNKTNNRAGNLEYATIAENLRHAAENGLTLKGERNNAAKLNEASVSAIRERAERGESLASISRYFGVTPQNVGHIVRGNSWRHANKEVSLGRI